MEIQRLTHTTPQTEKVVEGVGEIGNREIPKIGMMVATSGTTGRGGTITKEDGDVEKVETKVDRTREKGKEKGNTSRGLSPRGRYPRPPPLTRNAGVEGRGTLP
jgi:hypothetical protein